MAGVKGRSGGARPNSGPKPRPKTTAIGEVLAKTVVAKAAEAKAPAPKAPEPKQPEPSPQEPEGALVVSDDITPLDFLLTVMRNPMLDDKLRIEAAKTAAQYCHLKKGDGGIKEEKAEKAKKAGQGKFAPAPAPLRMVK